MRDCQLLFKPYDYSQIIDILESKKNMCFHKLSASQRQFKQIFHDLIDEKAYQFIAKKVSLKSGDIRVAFDLMASTLTAFKEKLTSEFPEDEQQITLSIKQLLEIYEQKENSSLGSVVSAMPRKN
jgi:Cdc6-like AAA superfamily ATPase